MMADPVVGNIYEELKGWQSALGAAFGLVALMLGALWNFYLNRRRDRLLREEEQLSIAVALYGEILLLRRELAKAARVVAAIYVREGTTRVEKSSFDVDFVERHKISDATLYRALAPKIGLLSSDLVLAIVDFHDKCRDANSCLPLMLDDPKRGYSYGPEFVLIPARDAVNDVMPALRKIEALAGIREKSGPLDLGMTEDVIEMQESLHAD